MLEQSSRFFSFALSPDTYICIYRFKYTHVQKHSAEMKSCTHQRSPRINKCYVLFPLPSRSSNCACPSNPFISRVVKAAQHFLRTRHQLLPVISHIHVLIYLFNYYFF